MKRSSLAVSKRSLAKFLKSHPEWSVNKRETQLQRVFAVPDYVSGLVFLARITVHAEIAHHHPDATLSYGTVKVVLTTHDQKCVTKKDLALAGKIDILYQKA